MRAVSHAGGLGIVTARTHPTPAELVREIDRCRGMTDRPFGVNITMLPAFKEVPYAEYIRATATADHHARRLGHRSQEKAPPEIVTSSGASPSFNRGGRI